MHLPITDAGAATFAREWIGAWNSHDAERIVAHCAADVQYESPFAETLMPGSGGGLSGLESLRGFVAAALDAYPDLRFTLRDVFAGERSLVIEYDSVRGLIAAETLSFGEDGKIERVQCHFRPGGPHAA